MFANLAELFSKVEGASVETIRDALLAGTGIYGSIRCEHNTTGFSVGVTPVTVEGYTSNGLSRGVTPDFSNNRLTVDAGFGGIYVILAPFSFDGTASTNYEFHLCVNGTEIPGGAERDIGTAIQVGSGVAGDVVQLDDGDVITFEVVANGASKTVTLRHGTLFAFRIA